MFSAYTDHRCQFQTYDHDDDRQQCGFDELILAIQLMPAASSNMGANIADPLRDPPPPPQQQQQVVADVGSGSGRKRGLRRYKHSKIVTAKGLRDRRMRLSLDVAKKFFYLQDVLGFDKASKTVDWLLTKSSDAIRSLTSCASGSGSQSQSHLEEVEEEEEEDKIVDSAVVTPTRTKPLSNRKGTSNPALVRESRAKARARARERTRERTREKKIFMSMTIHQQQLQQQQHSHESSVNVDYPFSFFQEYAGNSFQQQQQLQQRQEEEGEEEEEQEQEQEQEQEGGVLHPYFL